MQANYANALCHRNATPLSVAVLAPCAWGESVAWQSVVNSAKHNMAWRGEFGNETAQRGKIQWHSKASTANSAWQSINLAFFTFWIATLALFAHNDGAFCHFE